MEVFTARNMQQNSLFMPNSLGIWEHDENQALYWYKELLIIDDKKMRFRLMRKLHQEMSLNKVLAPLHWKSAANINMNCGC